MRVVCLSGGVGGAKLAAGLHDVLERGALTVIGNVGDDLEVLGLHIAPDLDSVLYALAGLNDTVRGWGRSDETWNALASARAWGGEGWFALGDLDVGLHLVRTAALRSGASLSEATARLTAAVDLGTAIIPVTDDPLCTQIVTPAGTFPFQEWFVARGHADEVDAVVVDGIDTAHPAPGVLEAIAAADLIVLAPSNPYVSLLPIIDVPGVRAALEARTAPCIAVSPLIGGVAVKGPLVRMLRRMAGDTTAAAVAARYPGLLDALVVDTADAGGTAGVPLLVTDTLMTDRDAARRLARFTLEALT